MSRNLTLDQLELMGIIQCPNPECNAAYAGDESTCRLCGTPLDAAFDRPRADDKRKQEAATGIDSDRNNTRHSVAGKRTGTRPRTKRTKAEAMALDKARRECPDADIVEQPMRLILTGGDTYTPDIGMWFPEGRTTLIEVKGGYKGPGWEQGIERYKRVKVEWGKRFNFRLWTWDRKQQSWRVE